ncbi:MAG: IS3 family transposase, partial [Deltaproteobacteria bacterium]|nr:IS3 family transposase [Deltaproteobacteria bacterium]
EVMGWLATSRGVSGEMVRDLLSETLEHRFGPNALTFHANHGDAPQRR